MRADDDARAALVAYTLERGDVAFIHQHVVDATTAQCAGPGTTPMQLTFALVGLYLHVERGFDGRRVQRVHAALARQRPDWPSLVPPDVRGTITAAEVVANPAGRERDAAIDAWCADVWAAYRGCRRVLVDFLRACRVDDPALLQQYQALVRGT